MKTTIIGVDGGGTKTAVWLADAAGTVLGRGSAPASNYQKVGFEAATDAVLEGIAAAFADAGLPPREPAAICLGLAGVDTLLDEERWTEWLEETFPNAAGYVTNDADLALAAGTPDGVGVALICGTGAIAVGRNAAGQVARADGWGYLLGDDGSGYWIGRAALRAVMRAHDGRGEFTRLRAAVLAHWNLGSYEELLEFIYQDDPSPATIASLAQVVNEEAENQDSVAAMILLDAAEELRLTLQTVITQLRLNADGASAPVALAGGVLTNSWVLKEFLETLAKDSGLRLGPVTRVSNPVAGAVRLAVRLLEGA